TDRRQDQPCVAAPAHGASRDIMCVECDPGAGRRSDQGQHRRMQRRSGGARIDRGRGVPRFPAAAAARPGALRSQPAHQLQAGLMSLRPVPDPVPWRLPRGTARAVALLALLAVAPGAPRPASAALEIEVTSGVRDPVPIAIVPFAPSAPADGGLDVAAVVQHDLEGSGRFRALARARMPATPTRADEIAAGSWKGAGSDYVVVGRVSAQKRSEEHTSELQSLAYLVCRLLLEKKKQI